MIGWSHVSEIARSIAEHARQINFRGESPSEAWHGLVEVISKAGGAVELHVRRSHRKKYRGKKWHSESVYVTISGEAWQHLCSAPMTDNGQPQSAQ